MKHVLLTVDVEDWYQVENFKSYIPFSSWPYCESRVEQNTHLLLDLLDSRLQAGGEHAGYSPADNLVSTKATFFVLGWLARRMPALVREIQTRGHEVASHGYHHKMCGECTLEELKRDCLESRLLLEDITGVPIRGYRAPSFSVNADALKVVEDCGYRYDSSFNSFAVNSRYGRLDLWHGAREGIAYRFGENFFELPVSNLRFGGLVLPLGGGGYFRLVPPILFRMGVQFILKQQKAYLFYLHPWEVDPDQPRVSQIPSFFRIRHYVRLDKTLKNFSSLLRGLKACRFVTCSEYLDRESAIASASD